MDCQPTEKPLFHNEGRFFHGRRERRQPNYRGLTIINLRDFYPYYTADSFIEVPDEVAEAMAEFDRREAAYRHQMLLLIFCSFYMVTSHSKREFSGITPMRLPTAIW